MADGMQKRAVAFARVMGGLMVGLGAIAAAWALLGQHAAPRAVWAELRWPFPADQWGRGKAFRCGRGDCGAAVDLYLRAKLGFCDCTNGVADDDDLHRMSDFDLVDGAVSPLGPGRPIAVGSMKGRSRAYAIAARDAPRRTALTVAFND